MCLLGFLDYPTLRVSLKRDRILVDLVGSTMSTYSGIGTTPIDTQRILKLCPRVKVLEVILNVILQSII